jgi:hypothetical protein
LTARAAVFGVFVCAASWIGLLVGAGNVGLQRAVTSGPYILLGGHPFAVPLLVGSAFLVAFVLARAWKGSRRFAVAGGVAVLIGDLVGAFLLAPLAVGELEIGHGPVVFVILSFYGQQVIAAFAGAWFGGESI